MRARHRLLVAAPFLAVVVFSGCFNNPPINPAELNFTWRQPNRADLVGTWVPTSATLEDMRDRGGYPISKHELVLLDDGSFSMLNMPDWWSDGFGRSRKGFESGSGTWSISQQGSWCVYLVFKSPITRSGYGVSLNLRRQKPPYLIHIFLGDPDEWQAILFERLR